MVGPIMSTVRRLRGTSPGVQLTLSLLLSSWSGGAHVRASFPFSVNSFSTCIHRHTQRCVPMVILNSVKLTRKMNPQRVGCHSSENLT